MKKLLLVLLAILVLFCISIYLFIPGKLNISSAVVVGATDNGTQRFIVDESNWAKWWADSTPAVSSIKQPDGSFVTNGDVFRVTEKFYKSAKVNIRHNNLQVETNLVIIPLQQDSTGIEWTGSVTMSANPFKRFSQYLEAKEVKKNMSQVLNNLRRFLDKPENIYGIPIERTSIKDTLFVSAKSISSSYPSTPMIYELIKKIQSFAVKNGVKQTGSPIYNINEITNKQFQLMAAIPIDKTIKDEGIFASKKMIPGSFMITEVVGGEYTVAAAAKSLQQYFTDYRKTSMAINFTMLITDRLYQTDTTKWITRLYMPVY